ncbi:hsp90 co-chaperone Cdc37, partial [Perkinsus olseni]
IVVSAFGTMIVFAINCRPLPYSGFFRDTFLWREEFERTIISDKKIESAPPPVTKDEAASSGEDTLDYMEKNEDVLGKYAEITDLKELEQFLYDHPVLLHE